MGSEMCIRDSLYPVRASNPEGASPPRQGPQNVVEDSRFKWLDMNYARRGGCSQLNILLPPQVWGAQVTAYELITANDNPGRDPTAWRVWARTTAHESDYSAGGVAPAASASAWRPVDVREGIQPPWSRFRSYGRFWLARPVACPRWPSRDPPPSAPPPIQPPSYVAMATCNRQSARCEPTVCPTIHRNPMAVHGHGASRQLAAG